jgi:hypothetical protein
VGCLAAWMSCGPQVVPKGPASAADAVEEQVDARGEAVLLFPLAILKPLVCPWRPIRR